MLVKYRDDKRISIICGSNFDKNGDFRVKDADYFLSVVPYTWGWATWRRNWEDYDYSMKNWSNNNKNKLLRFISPDKEHRNYWRYVFDVTAQTAPHDIWDYQFFYLCYSRCQYSIVPNCNLISNIGYDKDATHISRDSVYKQMEQRESLSFPLRHSEKFERNVGYDKLILDFCYGRVPSVSLIKKIRRFIKKKLHI